MDDLPVAIIFLNDDFLLSSTLSFCQELEIDVTDFFWGGQSGIFLFDLPDLHFVIYYVNSHHGFMPHILVVSNW